MLTKMITSMKANMTLSDKAGEEEQDPTVYLWLLYFTAQHFMYVNDYDKALYHINEAIGHTPTVIELYCLKSQIYKKAGDQILASDYYEEARKLDQADRYLNAKSSRYLIRVDNISKAEATMS